MADERPPVPDRPGPYQAVDWDVIDYGYYRLDSVPHQWRGPQPSLDGSRPVLGVIGAAQALGRFCTDPFPNMLGDALDLEVLNLAYSGAGPTFYLEKPAVMNHLAKSDIVIVQVMSGRSEGNSLMTCDSGRNLITWKPTGEECFAEKAFGYLLEGYSKKEVRRVVEETRANWEAHMIQLLEAIDAPTVLLWFSERPPKYRAKFNRRPIDLLSRFPHLVNATMLETVSAHADHFVEVTSARGMPNRLVDRFTGEPAQVRFPNGEHRTTDTYYPTPEMHQDATKALQPVIESCKQAL